MWLQRLFCASKRLKTGFTVFTHEASLPVVDALVSSFLDYYNLLFGSLTKFNLQLAAIKTVLQEL